MAQTHTKVNHELQTVLITGGTGLVGTVLSGLLTENGYTVTHLSRKARDGKYQTYVWDIKNQQIDEEAIQTADAILHLAGAGVADSRWTADYKKKIYDSRIDSTRLLRQKVKEHNPNLKHFISASAIGLYGWDTKDELLFETSPKGEGFLADVVQNWESEINQFDEIGVKNSTVRIGVVLSEKGGALQKMAQPVKFGVGAPLGSGKQYLSWIHIQDLCGIFKFILEKNQSQVVNGVAPNPLTNKEFTKVLAKQLKRPLWLPNVPSFVLKGMLGEMAGMILGGNKVSSNKIEQEGFTFLHPTLEIALQDLLS